MKILAYFSIALIINVFALLIKSEFIHNISGTDFLTMIVTILAINTATSSYIISKLDEISTKSNGKFSFENTNTSIKKSIKEQVILVIASSLLLIIRDSKYIIDFSTNEFAGINVLAAFVDISITLIFIIAISILWDTGKSMFVISTKKE